MADVSRERSLPEVVLVGGGHSHVQVLKSFAMKPPPARLTVVVDTPVAIYSGMAPGFVAGQYRRHELEIDVVPLARLARARLVMSPAVGIEPERRRLLVEDRPPISYDWICFDIGSTVLGLDTPGAREHAIPTRPISKLIGHMEGLVERAAGGPPNEPFRVIVVGAGAGGVELAFTVRARLQRDTGRRVEVCMVTSAARPLAEYEGLSARVVRRAAADGISVRCGVTVTAVEADAVQLEGGERLACDAAFWVTGATAHPLFRGSDLETDARGFLLTRPTLQAKGDDRIFATGDCATIESTPNPKAGVYAVRQGPYLDHNLRAALAGQPLDRYRPQSDFLTLLNLGDGTAIGTKWKVVFEGGWVMSLKDRIDRAFMRRFQMLGPDGRPAEELEKMPPMAANGSMLCGGCAAKVAADALSSALDRLPAPVADDAVVLGLEQREDAAAYRTPEGGTVYTSLDAFRAFTDDPWLVGRVAALNALSDLYAKGAVPRFAMALVTVPDTLDDRAASETLLAALAGVRHELDRLGVTLLGGHSTLGSELVVGLSVDGHAADGTTPRKDALEPGDVLVLTKALGTGVLLQADMQARAPAPWVQSAFASMLQDNSQAAAVARRHGVRAATDVTGFGLAGHLAELARASGLTVEVDPAAVPSLPGALELMDRGLRSTSHAQNRDACPFLPGADADDAHLALLFDPQTAGGLLLGIGEDASAALIAELHAAGYSAARIVARAARERQGEAAPLLRAVPLAAPPASERRA